MKDEKVSPFAAARLRASQRRPYFRQALSAMTPVPVEGLGTMAVDKYWRVYYDPVITEDWKERAAGVVVHEVGHLLRDHHSRADRLGAGLNFDLWGLCTDAEINDDGFGPDLPLPDGAVMPEALGCEPGGIAEQYYAQLSKAKTARQKAAQGSADGSSGSSSSGSNPGDDDPSAHGSPSADHSASSREASPGRPSAGQPSSAKGQSGESAGQSTQPGKQCSAGDAPQSNGGCGGGSGVDGQKRPWELPANDPNRPGLSEVEAHLIARAVARDIIDHCKMAGTVPGNWKRWAQDTLEPPKVPWTQELASVLRGQIAASGVQDYCYSRPSRRSSSIPGAVMPAMRARKPSVGLVVDTSGSMQGEDLSEARSEVEGICRAHQADVLAASVDTMVHTRSRITAAHRLDLKGGGGTDMGAGIAEMERAKVDVIIVLTDGCTPWPSEAPRARVIVCLLGKEPAQKTTVPRWAKAIVRKDGR